MSNTCSWSTIIANSNFVIKYFNSVLKVCFSPLFVKSIKHCQIGRHHCTFDVNGKILWPIGDLRTRISIMIKLHSNMIMRFYPARVNFFLLTGEAIKSINSYLSADVRWCAQPTYLLKHVPSFSRLVSCPVKLERRLAQMMLIYSYGKANATYCIAPFVIKGIDFVDYCDLIVIVGLTWTLKQSGLWNITWDDFRWKRKLLSPLFREKNWIER